MKKTLIALMMMGLSTGAMASEECFAVGLFAEKVYQYKEQGNSQEKAKEEFQSSPKYSGDELFSVRYIVVNMIYDWPFETKSKAGRFFLEECNEGGLN